MGGARSPTREESPPQVPSPWPRVVRAFPRTTRLSFGAQPQPFLPGPPRRTSRSLRSAGSAIAASSSRSYRRLLTLRRRARRFQDDARRRPLRRNPGNHATLPAVFLRRYAGLVVGKRAPARCAIARRACGRRVRGASQPCGRRGTWWRRSPGSYARRWPDRPLAAPWGSAHRSSLAVLLSPRARSASVAPTVRRPDARRSREPS